MFAHALVGVDLSKVSDYFVKWLPSLRVIGTKRLSLVYVIPLELVDHVAGFAVDKLLSELRRDALEKLEDYASFLESQGFSVDFKILGPSIPARRLADEADRMGVDYIVVASRGHGWLRELLLGSTVEELLRISRRSVLVSKPYRRELGKEKEIQVPPSIATDSPILAAVEFDEYLEAVLSCSVSIARLVRAELVVLHVLEEGGASEEAESRLSKLLRSLSVEVSAKIITRRGRPHKEIVRGIEDVKPSLVVIGGKPGSVLEYVVKRSPVHVFACK